MKKSIENTLKNDALIREVDEDLKNEQLKSLWDKYGLYIIIVVALALTAAVSFETFKSWKNKRNQELSNAYAVALSLQNQGRLDESLSLLQNLVKSSSVYGDIARLQIANIYLEQDKNSEALDVLQQLVADKNANAQMRDIATIKLASYKLDTNASAEEISGLLRPLIEDENNSWANIAHELLAMLFIRDGDMPAASAEYQKIISSPHVQDELKTRAQDMISLIGDQMNGK